MREYRDRVWSEVRAVCNEERDLKALRKMILEGINPFAREHSIKDFEDKASMLDLMAILGKRDMSREIKEIESLGLELKKRRVQGKSPFEWAASFACLDPKIETAIALAKSMRGMWDRKGKEGVTSWLRPFYSLRGRQLKMLPVLTKEMIANGANPLALSDNGESALYFLTWMSNKYENSIAIDAKEVEPYIEETAKVLISNGVPAHFFRKQTPLSKEIENERLRAVIFASLEERELNKICVIPERSERKKI